jgi:transposase
MRYEHTDHEWMGVKLMLPNKPHGVRRVNDRRILNGIFWVWRSGAAQQLRAVYHLLTALFAGAGQAYGPGQ